MSHSGHPSDPRTQPVPYKPRPGTNELEYQEREWTSGTRGGGTLPADLEWRSNPKQRQEERGAGTANRKV